MTLLFFPFCFPVWSVQSLSCVQLCDPMNHSTPGLPVHHQLHKHVLFFEIGFKEKQSLIIRIGTSLVVQWLRFCASSGGGPGSIPGQGTRSHMLWLRVHMLKLKILHATAKTQHKKKKKKKKFKENKRKKIRIRGNCLQCLLRMYFFYLFKC